MARFNMYYRALDFQYTVEKGREKKFLSSSSSRYKAESSLIPDLVSVKMGFQKGNAAQNFKASWKL